MNSQIYTFGGYRIGVHQNREGQMYYNVLYDDPYTADRTLISLIHEAMGAYVKMGIDIPLDKYINSILGMK